MRPKLCFCLVACLVFPLASAKGQVPSWYLQTGRYGGTAWNTTYTTPIKGDVAFSIGVFNKSSSKITVSMAFSKGLCGQGVFSGTVGRGEINLFGRLSSLDENCGKQSWNMVTRCRLAGKDRLACDYWLYPESGTQGGEQKGRFEVVKFDQTYPDAASKPTSLPISVPPQAIKRDPLYFSDREDPGVDVALVIAVKAKLRDGSNASNAILMEVDKGERLVLIDRNPDGAWYNVIHVGTATEGWIHGNSIRLVYTKKKRSTPIFRAEKLETENDPVVEISNDSDKDLNLRVGSSVFAISTHSKKIINLAPGEYKYYASAPGVLPALGEHEFRVGYRYTWTFWIRTVRR